MKYTQGKKESAMVALEEPLPKFDTEEKAAGQPVTRLYHIELTLNHPRTVAFNNAMSDKQKNMYRKRLLIMDEYFKKNKLPVDKDIQYEYCKSGAIHCHVMYSFRVSKDFVFSRQGLISDLSKIWLNTMLKRYSTFSENYMTYFEETECYVYRHESIKIAIYQDNYTRLLEWNEYIHKTDLKK